MSEQTTEMTDAQNLSAKMYDSLCDKLQPYVSSTLNTIGRDEQVGTTLEELRTEDNELIRALQESGSSIFQEEANKLYDNKVYTPEDEAAFKKVVNRIRVEFATESITSSLSEVLRRASTEYETVQLRDCLLPHNLGRSERPWRSTLSQIGISQEQTENLLRRFGQEQMTSGMELPWGGYVMKEGNRFTLYKSKPQ